MSGIIEFLTQLFQQGLRYSALCTARSALCNFVKICGQLDLSHDVLLCRFMRGVFLERPSLPRYTQVWDVRKVLCYLEKLEDVTLFQLSGKFCMLFLLLSAQRCQTLDLIQLQDVIITDEQVVFQTNHLLKQSKPGRHLGDIVLAAYPENRKLCIVQTTREYMRRTQGLRGAESKLLISTQEPHKGVSKATIARWVKLVMVQAGISPTFGAHSTRAVSTSLAKLKGVPLASILKCAGWSNAKTFGRFYDKSVENSISFQTAVLTAK